MNDKSLAVLLIEDNPGDVFLVQTMLNESGRGKYRLTSVDRLSKGLEQIAAQRPDIILLDLGLPDSQGLATLASVLNAASGIPVVVLTGLDDESMGVLAVHQGTQDYLVKGEIDGKGLIRTINYALERKNAEQTLLESEERYHGLFNIIQEGVAINELVLDEKGDVVDYIIVNVNPAFEKQSMYRNEQVVGRRATDIYHMSSEYIRGWWKSHSQIVNSVYTEFCHEPSGRWFGVTTTPPEGKRFATIFADISGRKMAETALLSQTEAQRILLDNITIQIFYLTNEHTYGAVNQAHADFMGKTKEEISNKDMYDFLPLDVAKICQQVNHEVFSTCKQILTEEWGPNARGEQRLLSITKTPKLNADGTVQYVIVSMEDITERNCAEDERDALLKETLRASDEWSKTFDAVTDVVALISPDHTFLRVNATGCRLAGKTAQELVGKKCYEVVHGLDHPITGCPCAETLKTKLPDSCEIEDRGRCFIATASPLKDDKGEVVALAHTVKDITERKRAEAELRKLRDKAEISSRLAAVGEMAAGIAHEINNPLTGVIGFSELLLMAKDLPPRIREQVKIISDGSQRVKEIVARMLTFARQSKPERTSVSVQELIDNTLEIRGYVLKTANIDVVRNYDPGVPSINADPGQLQQVFLNLIVNAEFAMKKAHGKGRLTITTKKLDSDIRISFQDDGPGMSAETKAKLFNPFFTTKDPGEGTGLGLSISRSIVLEHGGTIEVESYPGQGANFIITLPVTPSTEGAPAGLPVESAAAPEKVRTGRILVVDDEGAIRLLVKVTLGESGHEVDETGNPQDVLQKLDTTGYDVILLDMRMPGMSGRELHAQIMEKHPELGRKVIFMTGDTSDQETRTYLDNNNLPWIAKPFDIEKLKEKVDIVMRAG